MSIDNGKNINSFPEGKGIYHRKVQKNRKENSSFLNSEKKEIQNFDQKDRTSNIEVIKKDLKSYFYDSKSEMRGNERSILSKLVRRKK